jgi:hypothetical protein
LGIGEDNEVLGGDEFGKWAGGLWRIEGVKGALLEGFDGGLGVEIEAADRLHFIAKKFDSERLKVGEAKQVEDSAADGDLAALGDLGDDFVALLLELFEEGVAVEGLADVEAEFGFAEGLGTGDLGGEGLEAENDGLGRSGGEGKGLQGGEAFCGGFWVGKSALHRGDLGLRKEEGGGKEGLEAGESLFLRSGIGEAEPDASGMASGEECGEGGVGVWGEVIPAGGYAGGPPRRGGGKGGKGRGLCECVEKCGGISHEQGSGYDGGTGSATGKRREGIFAGFGWFDGCLRGI